MNKCNSCDWYHPKTSFCEYYLKGVETAGDFCRHFRSENEELTDSEVTDKKDFPEGFLKNQDRMQRKKKVLMKGHAFL